MSSEFPFLDALAEEIAKEHHDTEERAKQIITRDLQELKDLKKTAFTLVQGRINAHAEQVTSMTRSLTKTIDKLSNSGDKLPNAGLDGSNTNSKT